MLSEPVEDRLRLSLRSLRRTTIGCAIVAVVAAGLALAMLGVIRGEDRLHRSGAVGTALVVSVKSGSRSDSVAADLETPSGTRRVYLDVRPGATARGRLIEVRYLPGRSRAEAAGAERPSTSPASESWRTFAVMGLVASVFVGVALSYAGRLRRFAAIAASPSMPSDALVTYHRVAAGRSVRWYADLQTGHGSVLRMPLSRRPKPRPDRGVPEAALVYGDLEPGGYAFVVPETGRVVSPSAPLRLSTSAPWSSRPAALVAIAILVGLALLLLTVLG